MPERPGEISPQLYARVGGILYLLIILIGLFSVIFVRGKLIVSGDVAATASNIMASQSLWRLGIAADLVEHVLDIPVMLIIYVLLRPTNRNLALLALLFTIVQTAVPVANKLNLLVTLFFLGNSAFLKSFTPDQLHALSYVSLRVHDYGMGVGFVFFGFACLVEGYLIYRSGYLPRTIGILMEIAGLCYLTQSFSLILFPGFASLIFPVIMLPSFIAELSFCLWLIVKGVNEAVWRKKAGVSAAGGA